jgi:hypothetical protein
MIAVLGQALLAVLGLSWHPGALAAHMWIGGLALLISLAQGTLALVMKNLGEAPLWTIIASGALFLAEGLQMMSGRLQVFALHLPLGVAIFGCLVLFVAWTWARHAAPEANASVDFSAGTAVFMIEPRNRSMSNAALPASLLAHEFAQYWQHRWSHEADDLAKHVLWNTHVGHHLPEQVYVLARTWGSVRRFLGHLSCNGG